VRQALPVGDLMSGMLQPFPHGTPSDAEMEALRDADHARDVAAYEARCAAPVGEWYWPVTEVRG
jgi:hypothetical protein